MNRSGILLIVVATYWLAGCAKKEAPASGGEDPRATGAEGQADGAVDATKAAGKVFDKEVANKACEILTPALVSKTFGVPEAELKPMKVGGCVYTVRNLGPGKHTFEARFTMLTSHASESAAAQWFAKATRSVSKEEADKQMDEVAKRAKEREEIDTKTKKKVVDDMGELIKETTGSEGIQYESVAGVGDEARVNLSDGSLRVRVKNLTFTVSAYKGGKPEIDLKGTAVKDMAKKALSANREWMSTTVPARQDAAIKLGKAIVAALP